MRQHTPEYDRYIRSEAWERKRQARLKIDGHKCAMCGRPEDRTKAGLQVHHIHYKTLGNEDVYTDIVSLCASCHMKIHAYYRRPRAEPNTVSM